jgi:transcription antitermination factor NusG
MTYDDKNIFWFVSFAPNKKATKIISYLETADIEYFFPMYYQEKRLKDSERTQCSLQPILRNLVFVKSSKHYLDSVLKETKLQLGIRSNMYYRDLGSKQIIVVPEIQMKNFIAVAGCTQERIIYFSNTDLNLGKGKRVRIIGGVFAGVEGIFMRIKGDRRVVVSIPNLFSVATAFVPPEYILPLD